MKIQVEVKMLAVVVALFLVLGVCDGLVIEKCELGEELNSTLPANILEQFNNLVAKIVCHVELSSHLNTSTINYVTGPNIKSFIHDGQMGKSSESSSEESSEEDIPRSKSGINSSMVNPVTNPKSNNPDNGKGPRGRKGRSAESSSEESREEHIPRSKSGINSSMVNPVTHPIGNNSANGKGHRGRKGRSAESSSEESSEEHIPRSKSGINSSTVNPVTNPKGNNSANGKGPRGRKGRSAESSSEESDETTVWTLYGLFQLPDRIACTSGVESSLNLCSMKCDSLIDDDIRDDITCVQTILNKMGSAGQKNGPTKAIFHKMAAVFFQKQCKNIRNFEFFSNC